jgi:uncharacterized iron-regulated protein
MMVILRRKPRHPIRRPTPGALYAVLLTAMLLTSGCAISPKTLAIRNQPILLMEKTILKTDGATVLSQPALFRELESARVVYVGESHTNPAHHAIQLAVIKALAERTDGLSIGMEMFDRTYQPVLDAWCSGKLDEATFLERTHWYANWRFDFGLYRDILEYAKEKRLRIIALNIPFHIPGKIRIGGIASLTDDDRRYLPAVVDTTNAEHRAYVESIFRMHRLPGHTNFEYFYEAQCTWEDAMAQAIADTLNGGKMVVLVGNGHIIRKFGVPDRAFARTRAPFKTIYLAPVGDDVDLDCGDYIWVTPQTPMPRMPGSMRR